MNPMAFPSNLNMTLSIPASSQKKSAPATPSGPENPVAILPYLTPAQILSRIRTALELPTDLTDEDLLQILRHLINAPKGQDFDPKGILKSSRLHPRLAGLAETIVTTAWKKGLKVMVFEGYRDGKRQNELYARGTTRARAGKSYHNFGLAVDIVFLNEKGEPSWSPEHNWQKLGEIGKNLGLIWGGDFKRIKDYGHFELHLPR